LCTIFSSIFGVFIGFEGYVRHFFVHNRNFSAVILKFLAA